MLVLVAKVFGQETTEIPLQFPVCVSSTGGVGAVFLCPAGGSSIKATCPPEVQQSGLGLFPVPSFPPPVSVLGRLTSLSIVHLPV